MLKLSTQVDIQTLAERRVLKVMDIEAFATSSVDPNDCALWLDKNALSKLHLYHAIPFSAAIYPDHNPYIDMPFPLIAGLKEPAVVRPGDVISAGGKNNTVHVLYRRGANSNSLFITERCNSNCLMCSQPPRAIDDDWRLLENLKVIELIDHNERELGITGGEPTLIGNGLVELVNACHQALPTTDLHILTNGRNLGRLDWLDRLRQIAHRRVVWGVPLYSDFPADHDHIVQATNAFSETMHGLYNLERAGQAVEIRVVMHALSVPRLGQLCDYIFRNIPFAVHVALMGIEPIGFARGNYNQLWIDPADYVQKLQTAVWFLANRGITVSIYNLPLCVLPRNIWPFARQSISDWKNDYIDECKSCSVKSSCSGFFSWADARWISRSIKAIPIETIQKEFV